MKTTQILVKTVLMSMLTAGFFSLTSCSDEFEESAPVQNALEDQKEKFTGDGDILAGSLAATMHYQVNANGAWTIEKDRMFFRVSPESGVGPTDVKIYFQNNIEDERRVGHMTIKSEGTSTTLTLVQKTQGEDNLTRADKIETLNCVYAVGHGYNTMERWAHPRSVKCEIFDIHALKEDSLIGTNTLQMNFKATTVTGSSMNELTDNLASKAKIEGGFCKFKAEASANFDMNYARKNTYEYALTYMDATVRTARFSADFETLRHGYMTESAYRAINGLTRRYKGPEGFKHLIQDYGTHVAMTANLGGRICYSMALDVSKVEGSYDLKTFAKASYDGIVKTSGEVSNEMKTSYEQNASKCETTMSVQGGDETLAKALAAKDGFNKANVEKWLNSVTDENLSLMGFDDGALIPLYELVDDKYDDRYYEMKAYFDGQNGQISKDFDCMVQSTITKVSMPQFDANGTLVKDILLGGQKVGIICNEYVPQINMKKRVNVVYPVINGKPRLNLGFFLGDDDHKPGRCSWDGISIVYEAAEEMPYGEAKTLYLSGASVSAKLASGDIARNGVVEDAFMNGQLKTKAYGYPIVKIANNIWTRQDYKEVHLDFYTQNATNNIKVEGWKIPKTQDFYDINSLLGKYDSPMPVLKMYDDKSMNAEDLTGFSVKFEGCSRNNTRHYNGIGAYYWAQGEKDKALIICNKTGEIVSSEKDNNIRGALDSSAEYSVRLVKEM